MDIPLSEVFEISFQIHFKIFRILEGHHVISHITHIIYLNLHTVYPNISDMNDPVLIYSIIVLEQKKVVRLAILLPIF